MAFDDYADNHSVPPKSCRPQEVRENLPQSFHSLAVSEPDPITLFNPPTFLTVFRFSNDHAMSFFVLRLLLETYHFYPKTPTLFSYPLNNLTSIVVPSEL